MPTSWTPVLSGATNDKGLNTTTSAYATLKMTILTGNPMIGVPLTQLSLTWEAQYGSPASGTWQIKHYRADGTLLATTNNTATPPASPTSTDFVSTDTNNIIVNDYFTFSCLETGGQNRNPQFPTQPTIDSAVFSCTRETDGLTFNYVPSTWTSAPAGGSSGTRLPPPPIVVHF